MKLFNRKIFKAALVAVTTLAATVVVGAASPYTASAASCSGTLILHQPMTMGRPGYISEIVAYLDVYYSSANGGTNTACVSKTGRHRGVESQTEVNIFRCDSYFGCNSFDKAFDRDSGKFRFYAGPVKVTNAKSRCVGVTGAVMIGRRNVRIQAIGVGCAIRPRITSY